MEYSGMEGVVALVEWFFQLIYNYFVVGLLGTVLFAVLVSYMGKYAHSKLPNQHNIIGSIGIFLVATFIIYVAVILQGGDANHWMAAIFGLNVGVYHIDKVPFKIIMKRQDEGL